MRFGARNADCQDVTITPEDIEMQGKVVYAIQMVSG
jgi:hypothetical protein